MYTLTFLLVLRTRDDSIGICFGHNEPGSTWTIPPIPWGLSTSPLILRLIEQTPPILESGTRLVAIEGLSAS